MTSTVICHSRKRQAKLLKLADSICHLNQYVTQTSGKTSLKDELKEQKLYAVHIYLYTKDLTNTFPSVCNYVHYVQIITAGKSSVMYCI